MNFSKIWVNKLRPPFNTSSCIKLLPDFQADVLREFIDRATRATHTHTNTHWRLEPDHPDHDLTLVRVVIAVCLVRIQDAVRLLAIYCLSSFRRHAMLNASVFLLQLAFPFSKKSELLPLLFAHPDLNRQICACTTLSISVSVGRKIRLFSTILPSKSLEARRTYMRYQSYNHTESYALTTFTFSPCLSCEGSVFSYKWPEQRPASKVLSICFYLRQLLGLELFGVLFGVQYKFLAFLGHLQDLAKYLLREHSTPAVSPYQ